MQLSRTVPAVALGTLLTALTALLVAGPALSASARPELKIYFQSNLTDEAYQKKTFDRVAKKYRVPGASQTPAVGKKTVVQAMIGHDGGLVSAIVSLKSGRKGWDDAVLEAVRSAAPFDPLPRSFAPRSVEVHFHVSAVP